MPVGVDYTLLVEDVVGGYEFPFQLGSMASC